MTPPVRIGSEEIRCQECGQQLSTWSERHTWEDCVWWKQTAPMRKTLVGLGELQADLNALGQIGERDA